MYFIEPLAEETVADVGNSTGKNPIPEEPSAEHGAASPVAHSSKGDLLFLFFFSLLLLFQ